MMQLNNGKESLRVLRFLGASGNARQSTFNDGKSQRIMLLGANGKKILVNAETLDALHKAQLIQINEPFCVLTRLGSKKLKRANAVNDPFAAQQRTVVSKTIKTDGGDHEVAVNLDESPLGRLRRRRAPNGETWLNDCHVEAGDRLRRDFSMGQLMQKVTSSWDAGFGMGKSQNRNDRADISDTAIDARDRLSKALDCLGPDLAGVVTDVCCYLKGLECVERERRWPPRSAKLMLRTGLNLLSKHYGLSNV